MTRKARVITDLIPNRFQRKLFEISFYPQVTLLIIRAFIVLDFFICSYFDFCICKSPKLIDFGQNILRYVVFLLGY